MVTGESVSSVVQVAALIPGARLVATGARAVHRTREAAEKVRIYWHNLPSSAEVLEELERMGIPVGIVDQEAYNCKRAWLKKLLLSGTGDGNVILMIQNRLVDEAALLCEILSDKTPELLCNGHLLEQAILHSILQNEPELLAIARDQDLTAVKHALRERNSATGKGCFSLSFS